MPYVLNPFTGRLDYYVSGGSGGDVVGPGSSTTNDIAIFADNTGKLLADSGILYTDVLTKQGNLSGLANTATARTNLGLGSIAVLNDPLTETHGGTGQTTYTTGDIIYASASNTLSKLPIATIPGQYLNYNGTNVNWFNPLQESILFDDFITSNNSPAGNTNWTIAAGGTGSSVSTQGSSTDGSHPGTVQINTGTTTTGSAQIRQIQGIALGGGILSLVMVVKINNLSDGTDTYQFVSGLNGGTGINPTDGVYFTYSDSGASPNWVAATANSSSRTTTDTGVAVTTNWTTLQININAAGSSITYYIANSLVATITTNIPTARIGPFFGILKSAGATSRTGNIDMIWLYQKLTVGR